MGTTRTSVTLEQAICSHPTLAQLMQIADESQQCMKIIEPFLPAALRSKVRPGPITEGTWCLLVCHAAAATKLRQLSPAFLAALRSKGHAVRHIRFKIEILTRS